jgi:hypothetical protein
MDIICLPLPDLGTPTARALNQVEEKVDVPTGSNNLRDGRAGQQLPAPRGSEVDEIYKALLKSAETEFRENKRPRCSPIDLQSHGRLEVSSNDNGTQSRQRKRLYNLV